MANIVLQTENLRKCYGPLVAVENLSLAVQEGEVFGFLGPNGAGKTTSLNLMCGLLKPDAGRVLIHGRPIMGGSAELRTRVGVCPQNIVLWERLTCLEQLQFVGEMYGMPGRAARERGKTLLRDLDLVDKQNKQARTLSGGMQRRLNLLLALVHDPDIIILDEPEAGLDPQSRVLVRDYIKSLARGKTVILTTHNMDEADRVADRIAIIDHGKLLVLDTPEGLKHRVGAGDVLEIGLKGDEQVRSTACTALSPLLPPTALSPVNGGLVIRALDMVTLLPAIMQALGQANVPTGEVRLRENTLEDVFIQLTGRRLRE